MLHPYGASAGLLTERSIIFGGLYIFVIKVGLHLAFSVRRESFTRWFSRICAGHCHGGVNGFLIVRDVGISTKKEGDLKITVTSSHVSMLKNVVIKWPKVHGNLLLYVCAAFAEPD